MARRSVQLAVGFLLLVGLLGLSTALIAEVREQVLHRSSDKQDSPARKVAEETSGLPVPELILLDPTETHAPDRQHSFEALHFTGPGQLLLEPGEGVRPGDISLGQATRLVLGDEVRQDDEGIHCRSGCQLLVDNHTLSLPEGSLLAPPTQPDELRIEPAASAGEQIPLPADTVLALPEIRFPQGTQIDIGPGARAQIPDDRQNPVSPTGPDRFTLPADTRIVASPRSEEHPGELAEMLKEAQSAGPDTPAPLTTERPRIEITEAPETLEKGRPFDIEGFIEGPDGQPRSGHPVSVYANETKHTPGIAIHTGEAHTREDGTFVARAILPQDVPTRSYHLLARAHAQPQADPPLAPAWSDPLVGVQGEATLELDLPERAGVGVPLALEASLVDAFGAAVANQSLVFHIEGTDTHLPAHSGDDGQARTVLEEGLAYPGSYTIRAEYPGTDTIEGDEAHQEIEAIQTRIETDALHRAPRGEPTTIEGHVASEEADAGRVRLEASYEDNITAHTATDEHGHFELELPVPAWLSPGNHTVELEAPDAHHRIILTATAGLEIDLPDLGPQPVGGRRTLPVTITSDDDSPVPGADVQLLRQNDRLGEDVTDERGRAHLPLILPTEGSHAYSIRASASDAYRPATEGLLVDAHHLQVGADLRAPPGTSTMGSLRLAVDGDPLAKTPVRLVAPGWISHAMTDKNGTTDIALQPNASRSPGPLEANLSLPTYRIQQNVEVTVLEDPQLDVELAAPGREGEAVRLAVNVQASQGALDGIPLVARAQGAFEAEAQALTDEEGNAELMLVRPDDAEGLATIDVLAQPTGTTAAESHSISTQITSAPFPWGWVLAATAAIVAAGILAIRQRNPPAQPTRQRGPELSLAITPQQDGLPPVWHAGEPTTMHIQLTDETDRPIPHAKVHLEGPAGHQRLSLDENGQARLPVPEHAQGTATYRVWFEGDAAHEPTETVLEIRIVDYRAEIDEEYRNLRDRAHRVGLVGSDATPRELASALGPQAEELARLFERCDYSLRPVRREHYERFMQAKQEAWSAGHRP